MANTISTFHTTLDAVFNGVGDVVVFDTVIDASYAALTLSGLTNAKSLGNLYNGTVKYTGDAPAITSLKNEQGSVVYSYSEDGTFAFEATVMGLNPELVAKFLKGTAITNSTLNASTWQAAGSTHVGFGDAVASQFMPVTWLNRDKNIAVTFPKALVVASPADQDSGIGLKITFTAQKINKTADINTFVISTGVTPNYTTV